jgi:hypothetical protein
MGKIDQSENQSDTKPPVVNITFQLKDDDARIFLACRNKREFRHVKADATVARILMMQQIEQLCDQLEPATA